MIKRDALDMKNIIALISKIVSGNLLELKATCEHLFKSFNLNPNNLLRFCVKNPSDLCLDDCNQQRSFQSNLVIINILIVFINISLIQVFGSLLWCFRHSGAVQLHL